MTRIHLSLSLAFLCSTLSACSGDDATTEGSSGTASTSDTETSGTSTTSTTVDTSSGGTSGSDNSSTTGETDATTSGETDATTTGATTTGDTDTTTGDTDATTGDVDGQILASCENACEMLYDCFPEGWESKDECITLCVDDWTPLEPNESCEMAGIVYNECLAASNCGDLLLEETCLAEAVAAEMECGGDDEVCAGEGGSNPEGTECSITEECPDYKHGLVCDTEGCTCFEDDVMTETCEQDLNVCADFDFAALKELSEACCGW